ncbi:hypothetical protein [Streptomyces sp. NPDC088707]|uniref:hypothetical protein n=1 Tax=Streptomyces sp. NPDC088707 TaxID=3365871 RepID=UPI003803AB96
MTSNSWSTTSPQASPTSDAWPRHQTGVRIALISAFSLVKGCMRLDELSIVEDLDHVAVERTSTRQPMSFQGTE